MNFKALISHLLFGFSANICSNLEEQLMYEYFTLTADEAASLNEAQTGQTFSGLQCVAGYTGTISSPNGVFICEGGLMLDAPTCTGRINNND